MEVVNSKSSYPQMPPSLRVRTMISLADEITFKLYYYIIVPPPTYNSANIVFVLPPLPPSPGRNPPAMIALAVLSCMSNQICMNNYYYYSYEHLRINISIVV